MINIDKGKTGVSDPFVNIFTCETKELPWNKVHNTELMKENLNPDFEKSIVMDYFFEKHQLIKFEVMDGDGEEKLIGSAETTLGTIIGSKQQTFTSELLITGINTSRGKIIVRVDNVQDTGMEIKMKI